MLLRLLPRDSKRRKLVKKGLAVAGWEFMDPYSKWVHDQTDKIQLFKIYNHKYKPLISIVVPAYNTPAKYFHPLIESIVAQTYQNWELVIVNASDDKNSSKTIRDSRYIDDRIKVIKTKNEGISKNTNIGIKASKGEYIGFVDHDDTLAKNALDEVVKVLNQDKSTGLIYSDEDKLSENGKRYIDPHFKPDWSPHLLNHVNYITHFVVVSKRVVERVGYLDPKKDGAQDYDFLLRVIDSGTRVRHIPKILYHWRIAKHSTAADISNKPYVLKAGVSALKSHYNRLNVDAEPTAIENKPGFYETKYKPNRSYEVVITPFANETLVKNYLTLLAKRGMLDNCKVTAPYAVPDLKKVKVIKENSPAEYLQQVSKTSQDRLLILNDFVVPHVADWHKELIGLLNDSTVFAVAPVILNAEGEILDAGIVKTIDEVKLLFAGFPLGASTPFGNTAWPRDVNELTGSVLAVNTSDLRHFLTSNKSSRHILNKFTISCPEERYNVVWSSIVMEHVKIHLSKNKSMNQKDYFNRNLFLQKGGLSLYADEQQLVDALEAIHKEGVFNEE